MAVRGGAEFFSLREVYILNISLLLCLELFQKFVVGGGGWWVVVGGGGGG